ncbi:MAG: dihydroorotase [Pseudomonadota bacterium]
MGGYFDLILRQGKVVTISGIYVSDVGVKNGKICAIGDLSAETAKKEIDCTSLHVLPGVIDSQVHLREPGNDHKEDLETGGMAAIVGGVTSVFEMPNTNPSTTTKEAFLDKISRAKARMHTDHAFYVGATAENTDKLAELEVLPGCAGVKIFMGSSTGNLLVHDDETLERALRSGKRRIAIHAEDENRLLERADIAKNSQNVASHPEWRDVTSALLATQRIVALSEKTGRKIHILHISTKDEMEFLSQHKGGRITVEVLANHLTLAAPECYEKLGSYAQMNPPIRTKDHQDGLWKAVSDGTVDILATDHAPHTAEEKAKTYPASPSGLPGLQTFVTIMLDHVNNGKLSLQRFVDLCCHAPARVFGLRHKGFIRMGYDADFTIVDMNKSFTVRNEQVKSKCGWTPFDGETYKGTPVMTILRGQLIVEDEKILSQPIGKPLEFDV